jgi:hypothetical protein
MTYDQWKTTDPRELLPYDEEQEPMPQTFFQDFKTDNDEQVTVEYRYEDHGNCVVILEAWREPQEFGDVAVDVKLTDKEDERMCAWIAEHRHWADHDDRGDDYVR